MKEISAGGVVYHTDGEQIDILLIHDRFGTITLPKGKQEAGEKIPETALREIQEETGVIGEIVTEIETISYVYTHPQHGKIEKEVTYYLVKTASKQISPQIEEINDVAWYPYQKAVKLHKVKGYANNLSILDKAIDYLIKGASI
jgi:diadenosine hexaphosphate hydrolase (ATP-forming)